LQDFQHFWTNLLISGSLSTSFKYAGFHGKWEQSCRVYDDINFLNEMKIIWQLQLTFLGRIMRRHGLENLVVTGKIEGRRAKGRQRLKYLDSLHAS